MTSTKHPNIPVNALQFQFKATSQGRLPEYPGSAWRGALGHALKKTVCVIRNTPCPDCLLKNACAYSYIFETPPPANSEKMRKYNAAPHPFVLQFPQHFPGQNQYYLVNIHLFGQGERFLPYLIHAMQQAGELGIGGQRQTFQLVNVVGLDSLGQLQLIYQNGQLYQSKPAVCPAIPEMPEQLSITLHSPLRIKQDNKNLGGRELTFAAFFSSLLRRISMISYFHTDTPLDTDFAGLSALARTVEFNQQQLKWYDWTRYSSRQETEMNLGGLIGSLQLDMAGIASLWPYLWLGQWTHNGKATSMGLGAYSIQAKSLPSVPGLPSAANIEP